jgi:uncharacterized OB-fold protein
MTDRLEPIHPFFAAAAAGTLLIRRCTGCDQHFGPEATLCPDCLTEQLEWVEASGRGTLFSFGVMHQPSPGFEVPYNIAVVELEEGPRLYSSVVGCRNEDLAVGMPLEVEFDAEHLPRFHPAR